MLPSILYLATSTFFSEIQFLQLFNFYFANVGAVQYFLSGTLVIHPSKFSQLCAYILFLCRVVQVIFVCLV